MPPVWSYNAMFPLQFLLTFPSPLVENSHFADSRARAVQTYALGGR